MQQLEGLLLEFGILVGIVWAAAETLGRVLKVDKDLVALVVGVALALVAEGAGWVDVASGPWGYAGAALLGLLATAAAAVGHDKFVKPTAKILTRGAKGKKAPR